MTEHIAKIFTDEQRLALAVQLAQSTEERQIGGTIEAAAAGLGISAGDLVLLLNDAKFLKLLRSFTNAQATLTLHSRGISKLITIAETGKDGEALTAIKMLGTITGELNSKSQVDVRVTFEDLRRGAGQSNDDPLGGLFDIRSQLIEAADLEEETP